jgi:hypothetical protein
MIIVAVGFFIWLVVLTWIVLTVRRHYFNLISRTRKEHIDEILDALLATDKKVEMDVKRLKEELREEINRSKFHLQKIGLVRFNPFERIGGEQSFVLALLDQEDNGLTVNFIYTRDGLRVYTKRVKSGKGEEYDLSEEEKKAIEKSQK